MLIIVPAVPLLFCSLLFIFILYPFPLIANSNSLCFSRQIDINEQIHACRQLLNWQEGAAFDYQNHQHFSATIRLAELYTHQANFLPATELLAALTGYQSSFTATELIQFLRRQGILSYRQGLRPQALQSFKLAVTQARELDEPNLLAVTLSDIGTVQMAMMLYAEAIDSYQESLKLKELHASAASIAVTLNNIGSVFRHLGDHRLAADYISQAVELYEQHQMPDKAAHSREELGLILAQQGEYAQARHILQHSLSYFQTAEQPHSELRLSIMLADILLNAGLITDASSLLEQASQLDIQLGTSDQSAALKLVLGRLQQAHGHYQHAEALFQSGLNLAQQQHNQELSLRVLQALVKNAAEFSQWQSAYQHQLRLSELRTNLHQQQFASELADRRAHFEYEQQQKAISNLTKDSEIKELKLNLQQSRLGLLLSIVVLLSTFSTLVLYWQWRKRQQLRHHLEAQLVWHKEQVSALGASYRSLQAAFGQLSLAIMIFNNRQQLLFSNEACAKLLNYPLPELMLLHLAELIPSQNQTFWQLWNNEQSLDNTPLPQVVLQLGNQQHEYDLSLTTLDREEPLTLIVLYNSQDLANRQPLQSLLPQANFHQLLVDLMLTSLDVWEKQTGSSRIEMAEKSGIWRVSVDEGRIRTRSLDRYLSLKTLPKHPRWREVLRTAHFVLSSCPEDNAIKRSLTVKLDSITEHIRARSLF